MRYGLLALMCLAWGCEEDDGGAPADAAPDQSVDGGSPDQGADSSVTPDGRVADADLDPDAAPPDAAPQTDAGTCNTPNPEGCQESGCPGALVCQVSDRCVPSRCLCDGGVWLCTEDCGGGACMETAEPACETPNPSGCGKTGCPEGDVCRPTDDCVPSFCVCDKGEWACSEDCEGGACVPENICDGPLPFESSCALDSDCPNQTRCVGEGCGPNDCDCVEGEWACPEACGTACVPVGEQCAGPSPAGCIDEGCPEGEVCEMADQCVPSACDCGADGVWACSPDCGGGHCVPVPGP